MSLNQAYLFYVFLLTGVLIGLLFDIFRIFRKSFKHSDLATILQDIIFFAITSSLIIYTVFKFNNGEMRSYVFIGIISGLTIHIVLFSKIFIKISVKIIDYLKIIFKLITKIIVFPIKLIFNTLKIILFKPISFVFINIRKSVKKAIKNLSKIKIIRKIFHKKSTNKEGFYNNM